MGHSHATTGAAAWFALTSSAAGLGIVDMHPAAVIAGTVVTAGAALLPDADHHSGTIAHSLPPLSKAIASAVGEATGGHRHGTHSLIGVLVAFAASWALAPLRVDLPHVGEFQVGAWVMVVLLVAFAAKSLRLTRGWASSWVVSVLGATAAVYYAPEQLWWLPFSVALGCLVHIAGDALTVQGVPLLWPANPKPKVETPLWKRNGYFAVPILGTAGSAREWLFICAVDLYLIHGVTETLAPGTLALVVEGLTA